MKGGRFNRDKLLGGVMNNRYFKKRRWFGYWCKNIRKELIESLEMKKWACSFCPSRNDSHYMNCLECCPVKRAIS